MSNISSIRSAYYGLQRNYPTVNAANRATGPPSVSPEDREGELSRQLDSRLKAQLARIREQVGNGSSGSTGEEGTVLDIRV
ncbi:MAG TPA: hypothetical protein VKU00_29205 [Chthonomonadaceae bacterium]|nr:hypothetical protein [Chthonomonadaceae bacterium]